MPSDQEQAALKAAHDERDGCECCYCRVGPHTSDCAVHNEPAIPMGLCDCGAMIGATFHVAERSRQQCHCYGKYCNDCQRATRVMAFVRHHHEASYRGGSLTDKCNRCQLDVHSDIHLRGEI